MGEIQVANSQQKNFRDSIAAGETVDATLGVLAESSSERRDLPQQGNVVHHVHLLRQKKQQQEGQTAVANGGAVKWHNFFGSKHNLVNLANKVADSDHISAVRQCSSAMLDHRFTGQFFSCGGGGTGPSRRRISAP